MSGPRRVEGPCLGRKGGQPHPPSSLGCSGFQEDPPELSMNFTMRLRPGDLGAGPPVPREGLGGVPPRLGQQETRQPSLAQPQSQGPRVRPDPIALKATLTKHSETTGSPETPPPLVQRPGTLDSNGWSGREDSAGCFCSSPQTRTRRGRRTPGEASRPRSRGWREGA